MSNAHQLLVFYLGEHRYALELAAVERVVRMVAITPWPKSPPIALGAINVQGRIVPVLNIRQRFGLPERELDLSDPLIIAHTAKRTVALVADAVSGMIEVPAHAVIPPAQVLPNLEYVRGVVKLADGLVLIHDLDGFLSLEEDRTMEAALSVSLPVDVPNRCP